MKTKDWLAVGIRLFGVWMLIQGLEELTTFVQIWSAWVTVVRTSYQAYLFHGAVDLAVGIYLVMGAPILMSLSGLHSVPERSCPSCGYDLRESTDRCPNAARRSSRP